MVHLPPSLPYAQLEWREGKTPCSTDFGDIYYSTQDALAESDYVFLQGNQLAERWQNLPPGGTFTIAETGFGTGLNFLMAAALWMRVAPASCHLQFLSVEKSPVSPEALLQSQNNWPQLSEFCDRLNKLYPPPVSGTHRIQFLPGRVSLTLFLGEAVTWLENHSFMADAWFLDGFSPSKNPQLWNQEIFRHLYSHSHLQTSLATFSAAGIVRHGLAEAGFQVRKRKGFGGKRDMVVGEYAAQIATHPPLPSHRPVAHNALVIGSGLAGAHCANALAQRGVKVTVLDEADKVAAKASGNPQGALYIKLAIDWNPSSQIHVASYLHAIRHYRALNASSTEELWGECGLLQLAYNAKERHRLTKLKQTLQFPPSVVSHVSMEQASRIADTVIQQDGLYYPSGGWLHPEKVVRALLNHPNIDFNLDSPVRSIQDLLSGNLTRRPDFIVIATGHRHELINELRGQARIKPIRGQLSTVAFSPETELPKTVICGDGYVLPSIEGRLNFGATFQPNDDDTAIREEDRRENLEKLRGLAPELACSIAERSQFREERASIRGAYPDYLPAVGVYDAGYQRPETPDQGRPDSTFLEELTRQGIRVAECTGFGSKGLALCPLAADLVADQLLDQPLPLGDHLVKRMNPLRFQR